LRVLALAASEAARLRRREIGPEHVLLALIRCDGTHTSEVFAALGVELAHARDVVESTTGQGDLANDAAGVPPSEETRELIATAANDAVRDGRARADPGDLLLALLRQRGTAEQVLSALMLSAEDVRQKLAQSRTAN
jgi:ATP-dependent Clp protease ATP-binding subunit ClpA